MMVRSHPRGLSREDSEASMTDDNVKSDRGVVLLNGVVDKTSRKVTSYLVSLMAAEVIGNGQGPCETIEYFG